MNLVNPTKEWEMACEVCHFIMIPITELVPDESPDGIHRECIGYECVHCGCHYFKE